ncbi:serine/threonine-protein kinase [Archangium lansingense]|uniref:non-specific serine/threonine protein kinase n=1 Tax=Archangium lansingense TaxID=2995310 RepID=A0ABT4AE40_9BACT|nr:serine/threonine-protein kinase [Archangium lansinium]MCY1079951.1 serine/threonine-protein kinase [Archangium lansinium]
MLGTGNPPTDTGRFTFESDGFRYEVFRPLLAHEDYDTLFLSWCRPMKEKGARRLVVLKQVEVPEGRKGRSRAIEEVQLAEHLHHSRLGRVFRLAEYQGSPYVVMEHTRGAFLATIIGSALLLDRLLSPAFAAFIAAEVADALDYAHQCEDGRGRELHIIHRAVSPTTIRLGRNGRVKLTNFGAAFSELLGRVPTPPKVLRGNFAYAAPEIIRSVSEKGRAGLLSPKGIDRRADIFSLGFVLLEMLAGHHPLDPPDTLQPTISKRVLQLVSGVRAEHSSWASIEVLADRLLRFGPEDVERIAHKAPAPLKESLHRALRSNPAERYPLAAEMRDELRAYLSGLRRPFGAHEAAAELADILKKASALKRKDAHPVELGVLPWPKASSIR